MITPHDDSNGNAAARSTLATGSEIEVGKTYTLRHQRFGRAIVKILRAGDEWIDIEIVAGTLRGMTEDWGPGDLKTVRRSHCTFFPKCASRSTPSCNPGRRTTTR